MNCLKGLRDCEQQVQKLKEEEPVEARRKKQLEAAVRAERVHVKELRCNERLDERRAVRRDGGADEEPYRGGKGSTWQAGAGL